MHPFNHYPHSNSCYNTFFLSAAFHSWLDSFVYGTSKNNENANAKKYTMTITPIDMTLYKKEKKQRLKFNP